MSLSTGYTAARNGLWGAIDNWPTLMTGGESELIHKWTFNAPNDTLDDWKPSSIAQCPAVAVFPAGLDTLRKFQRWTDNMYVLEIHVWTPTWVLPAAEMMYANLIDAIFQSVDNQTPTSTTPWVRNSCGGFLPSLLGQASFTPDVLDNDGDGKGPRAIRIVAPVALKLRRTPYS